MQRIVVRHRKGSRAGEVEEFPLLEFDNLMLGRHPSSDVRFEPEKDDLVGRQHARIVRDAVGPSRFWVMDLNSRNGTFVNRSRVMGSMPLSPGDVIQLGAGGPEIEFDVDPRPVHIAGTPSVHAVGSADDITSGVEQASGARSKSVEWTSTSETMAPLRGRTVVVVATVLVIAAAFWASR